MSSSLFDGKQSPDEVTGAFVQSARWMTIRLALDPAVFGIRGARVDPGELEGLRVHPVAVPVTVGQEDRAVRHHGIEGLPGWSAAGEELHGPAASDDPFEIGVGVGVLGDDVEALLGRRGAVQLALQHRQAAHDGVHVRVLESGEQQPAGEIDDLGIRAGQLRQLVVGADGGDATVGDGDSGGD